MILAILGYAFIFYFGTDVEFCYEDGTLYSPIMQWFYRIPILIGCLMCVLYPANYNGMADRWHIIKKRNIWTHILESIVIDVILFFSGFVIPSVLEVLLEI